MIFFRTQRLWAAGLLASVIVPGVQSAPQDGNLSIDVIAAYNLVVDSNITTPAGYSPNAAHMGATICNTGSTALTDVTAYIGTFNTSLTDSTPGIYPITTAVGQLYADGDYRFTSATGLETATRYLGTLPANECVTQYWLVEYPLTDGANPATALFGANSDLTDDLQLSFDVWAAADESGTDRLVETSRTLTLRNELSAMANKIWPNTASKVPNEFLEAIEDQLGWRPTQDGSRPAEPGIVQGVWYDFGRVNQGFDNDGDLVPDYNAWIQPVGDASQFNDCFRMTSVYGILVIKLNDGTDQLVAFEDEMYFTNIPQNNTGMVGLVFYEFIPRDGVCSIALTPYQEVASGSENEKFNGDYGTFIQTLISEEPDVTFDKQIRNSDDAPTFIQGPAFVDPTGTVSSAQLDYSLTVDNISDTSGNGALDLGDPTKALPVIFQDTIPDGTNYVSNSADANNVFPSGIGATVFYSTNNGASWSLDQPIDPATVTDLQWWLDAPLPAGEAATVTFSVTVLDPSNSTDGTPLYIENTGQVGVGPGSPFAEDDAYAFLQGLNSIAGTTFADTSANPALYGNRLYDSATETPIAGMEVTLYFDTNGDGEIDSGDLLWDTVTSDGNGDYSFANLPDANWIVRASRDFSALGATACDGGPCLGWTNSSAIQAAIDLDSAGVVGTPVNSVDNDFGYLPVIDVQKSVPQSTYGEGEQVTYTVRVNNDSGGADGGTNDSLVVWSSNVLDPGGTGSNESNFCYITLSGAAALACIQTALGPPNDLRADSTFANSQDDSLRVDGFNAGGTFSNIVQVEAIFEGFLDVAVANDEVYIDVLDGETVINGGGAGTNVTSSVPIGADGTVAVDVTLLRSWTWADFNSGTTLDIRVRTEKTTMSNDAAMLFVDAVGFRVTAETPISPTGGPYNADTTLDPVELIDTFDTSMLSFASATVTPDNVNTMTGTITWNNVGPINSGGYAEILVTFDILNNTGLPPISGIDNTATVNEGVNCDTASSTGGCFANGLPTNMDEETVLISVEPRGTISGFVWNDTDVDGWQGTTGYDGTDLFIPNVSVALYACRNTTTGVLKTDTGRCNSGFDWSLEQTEATDATGFYEFTGLQTGYYYVDVDDAGILTPAGSSRRGERDTGQNQNAANGFTCGGGSNGCQGIWGNPGTNSLPTNFNLVNSPLGEDITDVNFGYNTPGALYGFVWDDANNNGVVDSGEGPLAGVTVTANTGAMAVTDANGNYTIYGLNAGTYSVTATTPTGYGSTCSGENTCVLGAGTTISSITIAQGEFRGSEDFGFRQTGSSTIGDTVYLDIDGDATQDAEEEGINGVTVTLYQDEDGDGVIDAGVDALYATTTTAGGGMYLFTGVGAGDWIVVVNRSTGGLNDLSQTQDPDEDGTTCSICDADGSATVDGTNSDLTVDFGFQPALDGSLSGTVFYDANGNAIFGTNPEVGIAGVIVTLEADFNGDGTYFTYGTQATAADGTYLFTDLPDGDYRISINADDDLNTNGTDDPSLPNDGFNNDAVLTTPAGSPSNLLTASITAGVTAAPDGTDFGVTLLSALGDTIFEDSNGNGVQDTGELGIPGVTVGICYDSTTVCGTPDETAVTDANGLYQFSGLNPNDGVIGCSDFPNNDPGTGDDVICSDFTVYVDLGSPPLSGWTLTADPDRDGIACDDTSFDMSLDPPPACDDATTQSLGYGTTFLGADFGYQPPGVIGDTVFLDLDADGIQELGEPAISGVIVQLTGDATATATTDADGLYIFTDLGTGNYTVTVDPVNFNPGGALENYAIVSEGFPQAMAPDGTATVAVASDVNLDLDFGYQLNGTVALSGTVCFDGGGAPGTCADPADSGVAAQTVYLYICEDQVTCNAPMLISQALTDGNGDYVFNNILQNSDYRVVLGTATSPLVFGTLLTTVADTPADAIVDTGTSVIQDVAVAGASVTDVDYSFDLTVSLDFGDLPNAFRTTLAVGGAYHVNQLSLYLGRTETTDFEADGTPSNLADGDDLSATNDEDGVGFGNLLDWTRGANGGTVQVAFGSSSGLTSGHVMGWIDFNGDGDFTDAGERIVASDVTISDGVAYFNVSVPAGASLSTQTYARFRLFQQAPLLATFAYGGAYTNGEVEDYRIDFRRPASIGDTVWLDADGDGIQDIGEEGIANVDLILRQDYDFDGVMDTTIAVIGGGLDLNKDGAITAADDGVFYGITVIDGLLDMNSDGVINASDNGTVEALGGDVVTAGALTTSGPMISFGVSERTDHAGQYHFLDLLLDSRAVVDGRIDVDGNGTGTGDMLGSLIINGLLDIDGDGAITAADDGNYGGFTVIDGFLDADGDGVTAGDADDDSRVNIGSFFVDVVDATVPSGLTITAGSTDPSAVVVLTGGENRDDVDFGYVPDGAQEAVIGDTVWVDTDGDGFQDAGELGLPGVTVRLFNESGTQVATTTTGAGGIYYFTDVPTGATGTSYYVQIDPVAGYTITTGPQSPGKERTPLFTVFDGDIYTKADFGLQPAGATSVSITDSVWLDADRDMLFDGSESGFAGVTVLLLNGANEVIGRTVTDAAGDFTFSGIATAGTYTSVITDVNGVLFGYDTTTAAAAAGQTSYAVVATDIIEENYGYVIPGSLSGTVYVDADGDFNQGSGEVGIEGVVVELQDTVCQSGVTCPTTITAADGYYAFTGYLPGTYTVVVNPDGAGLGQVAPNYLTNTEDPDADSDNDGTAVVVAGQSTDNLDFGYQNPGLNDIDGTVFLDVNADGVYQNLSESGFLGVTLELLNGNGEVIGTATTPADGSYSFPDLPAGTYTVRVTDVAGILDGYDITSGLNQRSVTFAGVGESATFDFGYINYEQTARIHDIVWLDADGDGFLDAGERPISGVQVDLYIDVDEDGIFEPGGDDGGSIATDFTDIDGNYLFDGLAAGNYFVDVAEAGTANGPSSDLAPTTFCVTKPDAAACVEPKPMGEEGYSYLITLEAGEDASEAAFGFTRVTNTLSLSGVVWVDEDVAGVSDGILGLGEARIPGVTITVTESGGASYMTTSATDGSWFIGGLPAGDYVVVYSQGDVTSFSSSLDETQPTNMAPGQTTWRVANAMTGQSYANLDFGFGEDDGVSNVLGSLSGTLFNDEDGDGATQMFQEAGELGIAGITLQLRNSSGNVVATTVTDVNGDYAFSGLVADTYDVVVTDVFNILEGLGQTFTLLAGVVVPAGADIIDRDAGYYAGDALGSIGNKVWLDLNDNERFDVGEPGIAGVTIECWLDNNFVSTATPALIEPGTDNLIRKVVTGEDGEYYCESLPTGAYIVRLTDDRGVISPDLTAVFDTVANANLDYSNVDDSAKNNPYALQTASPNLTADFAFTGNRNISGTVFVDQGSGTSANDADGVRQGGEAAVPNATVRLYQDTNGNGIIDPGEPLIATTRSNNGGNYSFNRLPSGNYIVAANTSGTSVSGYTQTTQQTPVSSFPQSGVQPVDLISQTSSNGNDFGFYNGGITTTPVTLASFAALPSGNGVEFRWTTATETSNVGFLLFAETANGELLAVGDSAPQAPGQVFRNGFESAAAAKSTAAAENRNLIASATGDAVTPQRYSYYDDDPRVRTAVHYWLVDVDLRAAMTWHGPFVLGRSEGREVVLQAPDWNGIRAAVDNNRSQRNANRRGAEDVRIDVTRTGIHRITFEDLIGIDSGLVDVPVSQLRLLRNNVPVAFAHNALRSRLESGTHIEFYGEAANTLYTGTNVYVLTSRLGATSAAAERRQATVNEVVDAWHLETAEVNERRAYSQTGFDGDPWYMDRMLAYGSDREVQYTLNLDRVRDGDARVSTNFWTVTDFPGVIDHHVRLSVNDVLVYDDDRLDGSASVTVSRTLDNNGWHEGANTVRLEVLTKPGVTYSLVNSNAFSIEYPRDLVARSGALDFYVRGNFERGDGFRVYGLATQDIIAYGIDDDRLIRYDVIPQPWSAGIDRGFSVDLPAEIRSGHYVVMDASTVIRPRIEPMNTSSILDGSADYVMISHPDFIAGLQPLVDYHQANGLSVRVVDVDSVYQQYSGGNFDPAAIDAFIEDAFYQLGTNYVLLVGGDTYDYRNDLGINAISFLPSFYRQTDSLIRFTPTDAPYADVNGDDLPDLAIGRFPVRTASELSALVAKTIRYGTHRQGTTALFASDARSTDANFLAESRNLEAALGTDWQVTNAAIDEVGAAAARSLIRQTLEGEGAALTSFFGHSGPTTWSFSGLFSAADAANLTNFDQPTVVTQWGCWNTYFVSPNFNTMAHRFMVSGEQGAAAVLGAATLTTVQSDRDFGRRLVPAMTAPGVRVGDALMDAKNALGGNFATYADVIIGFNLLGDPALMVRE